jgi:hypothetical protein
VWQWWHIIVDNSSHSQAWCLLSPLASKLTTNRHKTRHGATLHNEKRVVNLTSSCVVDNKGLTGPTSYIDTAGKKSWWALKHLQKQSIWLFEQCKYRSTYTSFKALWHAAIIKFPDQSGTKVNLLLPFLVSGWSIVWSKWQPTLQIYTVCF